MVLLDQKPLLGASFELNLLLPPRGGARLIAFGRQMI